MDKIQVTISVTPGQLNELAALVQKWEWAADKKPAPAAVLSDYAVKPKPFPTEWPEQFKGFMNGLELERARAGMTIKQMAQKLGIAPNYYYVLKGGKATVRKSTAYKYAERGGYSVKQLCHEGWNELYGGGNHDNA